MRIGVPALVLATSAGTVFGQCNIYKYGVPDFDQRRAGLDDDGSVHCVPTAAVNWMGYIANHGRPAAMGHSSSNWAASGEYSHVTGRIGEMGDLMGTGGLFGGGTSAEGAADGLVDYFDDHNIGPVVVTAYISDADWQIRPFMMYNDLKDGLLVEMIYGRYYLDGDQWERDGGHAVTLCSMQDACDSYHTTIGFKDPWTGSSDSLYSQSTFKTKTWEISKQTRNYDGDGYAMWGPAGQMPDSNGAIRLIDKYVVIAPLFTLTKDQFSGKLVKIAAPFLNNDEQEPMQLVTLPSSAPLLHASIDPRTLDSIVLTGAIGAVHAKLWDYSPAQGSFTEIIDLPTAPSAFTIDRRGDLLLLISGDIHKYRYAGDGSVRSLATGKIGSALDAVAVDDKTDDVYVLSGATRRLLKYPAGDLLATPYSAILPTTLPLGIAPCVAVNPADGKPWVGSEGSTSVYQLTPGVAAPGWTITGSVQAGAGAKPKALQFGDKGQMKFISNGAIKEFNIDPASGRYIPTIDPVFNGQPASAFLCLARSRTNFDPLKHVGRAWASIIDPDLDTPEVEDCPADFNGDGFVDPLDYNAFINAFEAGSMNADFNFDGFLDPLDYNGFINAFEAGC